jgi:hypothetical protein
VPHRVPSYAAPERLRWTGGSLSSPCEDFYGLGIIVRNHSSAGGGGGDCLQEPNCAAQISASAKLSCSHESSTPWTPDRLWSILVSSKPSTTVLDVFLQPDCFQRAFKSSDLQKLIELHGSDVFISSCLPLVEIQTNADPLLPRVISETSGDSDVASFPWIQAVACEIMDGKCISASLCQEILKLVVVGETSKKDIIIFLQNLLQDRVLFKPVPWFTYFDIEALKQYDVFIEKSAALIQQYDTMDPSIQAILLHMAACPYFIPFHELVSLVQV